MKSLETPRSTFWQIVCCAWLLIAQIWYYGQFRELLRTAQGVISRQIWHR